MTCAAGPSGPPRMLCIFISQYFHIMFTLLAACTLFSHFPAYDFHIIFTVSFILQNQRMAYTMMLVTHCGAKWPLKSMVKVSCSRKNKNLAYNFLDGFLPNSYMLVFICLEIRRKTTRIKEAAFGRLHKGVGPLCGIP